MSTSTSSRRRCPIVRSWMRGSVYIVRRLDRAIFEGGVSQLLMVTGLRNVGRCARAGWVCLVCLGHRSRRFHVRTMSGPTAQTCSLPNSALALEAAQMRIGPATAMPVPHKVFLLLLVHNNLMSRYVNISPVDGPNCPLRPCDLFGTSHLRVHGG